MKRAFSLLLLLSGFFGGCATSPRDSETAREVVLQYLGSDAGTAGPFAKHQKKELDVLPPKERGEALALLDRGAVAFLVFETRKGGSPRVVLVMSGRVVGDFRAPPETTTK